MPTPVIDVWTIPLEQPAAAMPRLRSVLSSAELTRAGRFVYPVDHGRYLVAHAAMRCILGAALELAPQDLFLAHGPQGKPFVPGAPLHFNLSHAHGMALLALSPTLELGVDLEPIRVLPDFLDLAATFAAGELQQLRSVAASTHLPRAFFECWTRKEAYVKALGTGLTQSLGTFEVTFFPSPRPALTGSETGGWQIHNLDHLPGYAAALCHRRYSQAEPVINHHLWQP